MPEQDNLEFRKKTYKNLKTAFGDDYTLTEEQFNKNMDSDTAFVTKTYKNLKTAFGDDYSMVEEDFKKKVFPISGSPTTSASTSGSSLTQPSSGSGDSQSPAYSVKVDEGPMRKGQPSTVTVGGKEFEVAPTPELTSTEVKSTANKLFKIASPITSAAPKIPQSPVMDGVVKPTDEAAISNLSPKAASGNEDVLTEYISTLNEADQNRLRGSKMNDEQSFEILTKAYAPRLEQAVIDLSILRDRGVENDLKAIDDSQKQMQTLTQTISADKTALVDLQATFLKQKGYDKISSEYKSINKQLQVKQTELAPLFKEQQQLETTLKQFESLIQDGNFVGNEQEYNAYQETYKAYEQLTQSPELANYNNLVKKQNEISSSINSMVTPEYKAQEEKLLGRINTTVASANTLMQNSQGLLTPEKIENIELYKQTVEEYNSITNKLQTAKSKMPDVIEKEAYINAMNAAVKDNPYLKAFDLSAKAIGGFTEAVGSLLSAVPSFTGGMSNEYTFSDKVSESITNFFAPSITNTQTTTAGRPSAAYQPFYDSEIDHINWSSLPDEIANQAGAFAVLAGSGVLGGMAKFSEISSVVVPGALISYNDAYKTGREIYGDDAFSATAYATASSLITGITELIMPDRDILTGGSVDKIAKNYVVNYAKKGKRFAIERSLLDLTEMMGKEVTEEFADRWKDVLLKGVVNMTGGDIDNDIPTLNEQLSIAASTAALTGGGGAFSQRGKNSKARQLAVYQSAKSYPETITMLNTMEQEGYDADRIDAIKSEVTNMFVTLKEVPADLSAPKRIAIAEKLNTIKKIEDAMASGISPFIADRMNDSIKKISDDIQNIITDPNYDEVFGKEVNEDVAKSEDVTVTGMPVVEITPTTQSEIELKNEGKAKAPTKESVTERLNINNPFYRKVEDALVKLGLIEKYNPETGTGDVVGGYAQQTSDGGFSVGKMLFSQDGSISYFDGDVKVSFDKNGNVISENTKEAKQKAVSLEIESKKESIANLEKTRDSEAFKYKEVTETDVLGNKKKVKRLKTPQELKESTDKINEVIDKTKAELAALNQPAQSEQSDIERRTQEEFNNENESYRVIVGDEAFNDIVESGVVRTNADSKKSQTLAERLANRPTLFPSFSKGKASMEYAAANPNNYIIVTEDPSIQPSTAGRHGKGTTMFPTDENGNHLKELSGKKVKVYKHIGNGEYILVYANGKVIEQQIEKPAQSESVKEDTTQTPTTDGKVNEKGQGQQELLTQEQSTEDAAPIPEAPPLDIAEPSDVEVEDEPTTKGSEQKERAFTKQVKESTDISGKTKAMLPEDAVYYMTQTNEMSVGEARKIINEVGITEATKILKDLNNGINGGVRSVLGQLVIKQLEESGDTDGAIDVLNFLTERATDSGQFIQAFMLWAALTPQGQVRAAMKMIKEQQQSRIDKQKAQIDKVKDAIKEGAKEAIDKALVNTGVKAGVKLSNKRSSPSYGANNKIITREKYLEAKAKLKGKLFSNPLDPELIPIAAYHLEASGRKLADFTANLLDEFGSAIRPYIKPMYDNAKAAMIERGAKESDFDSEKDIEQQIQEAQNLYWEEEGKKVLAKLDRAIKTKNEKAYKEAIAQLQSLPNRDELWSKYKDFASKRLANLSAKQFAKDANEKPVLQKFTDELVRMMQEKIKESLPESERSTATPRPVIEVIADAFKNKEKYEEVWQQTQEILRKELTNEQLAELDAYFGNILDTPFSQKQIAKAVKDGLVAINKKVADIARAHYTQYDAAKRTLTDRLIAEADLPEADARQLADAISKEFDRVMTEKKKQILNDMFKERTINKKQKNKLEVELQSLLNLGAFNDDMFVEKWAKANDYPILTAENIAEIERLAEIIQKQPDGSKKFRAIQDLLKYQATIKGVNWKEVGMAVWYANILSGYDTQLVNAVSTSLNVFSNYLIAVARNPKSAKFLAKGFYNGFKHGLQEASEVVRTGYDPVLKGKVEMPATLEIKKYAGGKWNPANYLKYVRRVMMATDVVFFEGAKEMRAYQLARSMAMKEGKIDPSLNVQERAEAILNKTDYDQEIIIAQVELEYQNELDAIEKLPIAEAQKNELRKQAKRDRSRRVFEKTHLERKDEIIEGAANFASRATYNYKPEGVLGYMVNGLNMFLNKVPVARLVIPFTNIIANVANEQINYTPIGFIRAARDGSISGNRNTKITELEKAELYTKAFIGTGLMTSLLLAAIIPVGDDDEPLIEITSNGTGDYGKNYNLKDWQAYSFRVKGLDGKYGAWISYQYSPYMVAMSIVGNLMDGEKYRGDKLKDETTFTKFSLAMSASTRVFLDMTFLASLNSALDIIMNPFNPNILDAGLKTAQNTTKSFIIPNLYTQTFKQVQASFDIPNKETKNTWLGFLLKDIPIAREMYKDQIDVLGNPVVPDTDKFFKVVDEDLPSNYKTVQKRLFNMKKPSIRTVKVTDPATREKTKLTQDEYYLFSVTRGKYINDEITRMKKEGKGNEIDKAWGTSTQRAATYFAKNKIYQLRELKLKY
jgi:hypothetical protein